MIQKINEKDNITDTNTNNHSECKDKVKGKVEKNRL